MILNMGLKVDKSDRHLYLDTININGFFFTCVSVLAPQQPWRVPELLTDYAMGTL